jgi:hypothetical protein
MGDRVVFIEAAEAARSVEAMGFREGVGAVRWWRFDLFKVVVGDEPTAEGHAGLLGRWARGGCCFRYLNPSLPRGRSDPLTTVTPYTCDDVGPTPDGSIKKSLTEGPKSLYQESQLQEELQSTEKLQTSPPPQAPLA